MKIFIISIFVFFNFLLFSNGVVAQPQQEPQVLDFYNQINPRVLPNCAAGVTGVKGLTNCISSIADKLEPIAAALLVLVVTISAAYLIFSPLSESGIQKAKQALLWAVIGFVIVFAADLIRLLIEEIAGE